MDINKVMQATLGEIDNKIKVRFKKTVQVKQYETEVIEAETEVTVDKEISGGERMLMTSILAVQLEYTSLCNLVYKGIITPQELETRRTELINGLQAIKAKAEKVLGKSLEEYFE